jgi:hypothetical protein
MAIGPQRQKKKTKSMRTGREISRPVVFHGPYVNLAKR